MPLGLTLSVHRALQDPAHEIILKLEKNKVLLQSMRKVLFHVKFGNVSSGGPSSWSLLVALWGIPNQRFPSIDTVASGLPSPPWLHAAKLPDEESSRKQEDLSISSFLNLFIVIYQSFLLQEAQSQEQRAHIHLDHIENVLPSWLETSSLMP